MRVCILGHMQRGGTPTCMERVRACRMGAAAVQALLNGRSGEMIGIVNNDIHFTPFGEAIKDHPEIDKGFLEVLNILSAVV